MGSRARAPRTPRSDGPLTLLAKELGITWRTVLVFAGGAAIVGGVMLAYLLHDRAYSKSGPGELRAAHLATLADGRPIVVVSATVRHSGGDVVDNWTDRLEVLDVASGALLAREVVDAPLSCIGARPGLLWCDTNLVGGSVVELRDAATLAVRAPHAKVIASAPPLSRAGHAQLDPATGDAWLPTSDGRYWHVAPDSLVGAVSDAPPRDRRDLSAGPSPLTGSATTAKGTLYFDGSPRATLMLSDGREGKSAVSSDHWLHPELVLERASTPLALDGTLLLIAHTDSVDLATAQLLLSAISTDGVKHWTTPIGHGELAAVWVDEHRIVLVLRVPDAQGSVLALDRGDGHVLWRTGM